MRGYDMVNLFERKGIEPMLIKNKADPFNSKDFIYEIKYDGIRCIAYLSNKETDIRNKRDFNIANRFPELSRIHECAKDKCIVDGEIIILKEGIIDFYEVQRRTILTDPFKTHLSSMQRPATFIAYDIIYLKDHLITTLPLIERKRILEETINENNAMVLSRYIEEKGIELFELAKERQLEGVVAKHKDSKYYFGKRSKDWIKLKVLEEQLYVLCGYLKNKEGMNDIIIGRYVNNTLIYKGLVSLGVRLDFISRKECIKRNTPPFTYGLNIKDAIWLEPNLVCKIEYMPSNKDKLRQPVYKGIVENISPYECQDRED